MPTTTNIDRKWLTPREAELVELLANTGWRDASLGARMYLAPKTVQSMMVQIRVVLGCRTRAQICLWAWTYGHIDDMRVGHRQVYIRAGMRKDGTNVDDA